MAVEPFPFATLDELKARWPDMPPGSDTHAGVQLEDASQFILDVCPSAADASPNTRRRVVCAVVKRSMEAGSADMAGFESISAGGGPFQYGGKVANPSGDFYLTKQEKKALGDGAAKAFSIDVADFPVSNHRPWCSLMLGASYCSCGTDIAGEPIYEGVP